MTEAGAAFTAGPPVVKESLGEDITKEALGGPSVAIPSGLVHNVAPDDAAALDVLRHYLCYFPSSAWVVPARGAHGPDQGRAPDRRAAPTSSPRDSRRVYDMRDVLDVVVDDGAWFEVQPGVRAGHDLRPRPPRR